LIGYSITNKSFVGNSGWLVSFRFKSGTEPTTSTLALNQATLGDQLSNNILSGVINGSVTVNAPKLSVSTNSVDFGRVALGTSNTQSIQLLNTGNTTLTISNIEFNDTQFSVTQTTPLTIAPQTSQSLEVKFLPALKGKYTKQMQIKSNDPRLTTTIVTLNAVGFMVNEIHTGSISAASSTTQTLDFSINNMEAFTGFQFDINLPTSLTYKDGTAKLFRLTDQIVSVHQISSQILRVVAFSPENRNFTGLNGKVLSLDFSLFGSAGWYNIGISNVIIANSSGENIVSDSFGGSLNVTCPSIYTNSQLNFGDVSLTSQKELNQTISNSGQETLVISQLTFSNSYFSSSQTFPLVIPPYQQKNISVLFKKTSKGQTTGVMKIYSNDPNVSICNVNLSANAYAPNFLKIDSTRYFAGESRYLPISVDNIEEVVALQFDLNFPENFVPDITNISLTERSTNHVLAVTKLSNTDLRIILYNNQMQAIIGNNGAVIKIPFKADLSLSPGIYSITLSNSLMSNSKSENILYSNMNGKLNIKIPKYGDADGNDKIEAYDAALLLRYSANIDPIPKIDPYPWQQWRFKIGDVDGSGKITAYDAALVLRKSVGLINSFPAEN
jgi:hypothetical protein